MPQSNRVYRNAFVVTNCRSAGWARAMASEICHGLNAIGVKATLVGEGEPDFDLPASEPFFFVDLNRRAKLPRPVPKVSIMVDHPCTRLADLQGLRAGGDLLGWVDASHPAAAARLGVTVPSFFLPHAGPDPIPDPPPMHARDIDIFFSGGLAEPFDRVSWLAARPDVPEVLADAIFDAAAAIDGKMVPALPAFIAACAAHGLTPGDFSRELFCMAVTKALEIAEHNRRIAVLTALPAARIAIASDYLPAALRNRPNIRYLGYIDDFAAIHALMARSKIVLNTTNKFPQGSHERIWAAMAQGAVVLTDPSGFLSADFADERDILYLPGELSQERLDALLAPLRCDRRLRAMAASAGEVYRANHTWAQRASTLCAAVEGRTDSSPGASSNNLGAGSSAEGRAISEATFAAAADY